MSQIFGPSSEAPPPTVTIDFDTDVNSPAIPIAEILNVIGGQTSVGTAAGIRTDRKSVV